MSRSPTTRDLIDYLQQHPDVVVVLTEDDVQSPGDYVALDSALQEIQASLDAEAAREGGVSIVEQPQDQELGDYEIALSALPGNGDWEQCDGPETGVGNEFWFEDRADRSRLFYVCVDQGELRVASEHRDHDIRNVPPRHRR